MDKLIIYCRAVPYKKNEVTDDCCEMYSFSETSLCDLVTAKSRGNSAVMTIEAIEGLDPTISFHSTIVNHQQPRAWVCHSMECEFT